MSWPWKKKSSDKAAVEKVAAILDSAGVALPSTKPQADPEKYKKPNYVQISLESYSHLTGLEEQLKSAEDHVRTLESEITELNEKLSAAESETTTQESLVKQHSKVAEEAVSGWEKAEAEALALKNHLESVTLDKLTAEDRASHLDGALKECMRQIRNMKEEHERNLQEVALTKTKQLEKIKHEFEAKMDDLDQELRKSAAENLALSRSLQERSNMLIKITEEKTLAEGEIELLKGNIEVCEKEIHSLKYELHVVTKELEIRNEEKNMSARSAEVANKQHMEGVKKIAKLEAECQRLRGLVRKKLPGPAALAQMKLEVESLGRDPGDSNIRWSPSRPPSARSPSPDYSFDGYQKFHKENEFLTERMLTMEEETKMLKEALAQRNSELQASRTMCAKATSRLQILEQLQNGNVNSPKSLVRVSGEASLSHNASNPPSLTSLSEDGNDDDRSCAESWPSASMSEFSPFNKDKNNGTLKKADRNNNLELMDDFLEMEKLACSSSDLNGSISSAIKKPDGTINESPVAKELYFSETPTSSTEKLPMLNHLESRISAIFKSMSKEGDMNKVLEDIKTAVLDVCSTSPEHQAETPVLEEDKQQGCPGDAITVEKDLDMLDDTKEAAETHHAMAPDLEAAINRIYEFVTFLGKVAMGVHGVSTDDDELEQKIEAFSVTYKKVTSNEASLFDFMLELSRVLTKASDLKFNILGYKGTESVANSPDYVDKVALLENSKIVQQGPLRESYQNGHATPSDLTSHPDVAYDGTMGPIDDANANQHTILLEDYEKLRSENDKMVAELTSSAEDLEAMKSKLQQTEQLLAEVKSQLATALNSFSLAETQLKCMAESYRSLEMRSRELETEVNLLQAKTKNLDNELQEEKRAHQDALDRAKDLQDQLESIESHAQEEDVDAKTKQEAELAAAAEKLAECQQTIFLLGKQLNSMRPPNADTVGSPMSDKSQHAEGLYEYQPTSNGHNSQELSSVSSDRSGPESQLDGHSSFPGSPSEVELGYPRSPINSKLAKHRSTLSGSSTTCSIPEKQSRGISRFFSSKGKNSAY